MLRKRILRIIIFGILGVGLILIVSAAQRNIERDLATLIPISIGIYVLLAIVLLAPQASYNFKAGLVVL